MKRLIFVLTLFAFCSAGTAQTWSFPQMTTDYARPIAGAEYWYGQNAMNIGYKPLDGYWRFTWSDNQDLTTGANNFTNIDNQIRAILAIQPGMKFSIGVMTRCGVCSQGIQVDGGKSFYPIALHKQMQAEANTKDLLNGGLWIQNYNSPSYIAWEAKRNKDLGDHIRAMGWENNVEYIDNLEYGDYGEWTTNDLVIGTRCEPTAASLYKLIDGVFQGFPNSFILNLISAFDGNLQLGNTKVPPEVGEYALKARNNKGLGGWKRMSWGDNSFWNDRWSFANTTVMPDGFRFDTAINNRYKYAPVCGEPINFANSANPGPYDDVARETNASHASNIGNGNYEANLGNAHGATNMINAFYKMGARLSLTGAQVTGQIVKLFWSNTGLTPTYEDWDVTFELRNGSKVISSQKSAVVLKVILNGTLAFSDNTTLSGTGDLYVVIRDPSGVRTPYPLNIPSRGADGGYLLGGNVTFGGGSGPKPPDPPLPTNCDTTFKVIHKTTTITPRTTYDTVTTTVVVDTTIHRTCNTPGTTLTIFTNQVPTDGNGNDYPQWTSIKGIEPGVKFTSTVAGYILGVRFYKTAENTGQHIGEIYQASGIRIASQAFTNETGSGWQTVLFSTPIPVSAQTTYVAAYFSANGNYLETNNFFKNGPLVNGTLSALKDGTGGASGKDPGTGNGLYIYTPSPAFPNQLYMSQNNWVDVIFSTTNK